MPRTPGASNRNKQFLLNRLQKMYGEDFHPILKIAKNCVELQKTAESIEIPTSLEGKDPDPECIAAAMAIRTIALKSANAEWSRIAEYTEPKLKSVEIDLNADLEGLTLEMHYGGRVEKPKKKRKNAKD